ncbi:GDP-L-fucose synthase family protein [Treponema brennaborense]|uniref:GDP-L-fucose synthase n=1 Tax=Treponema brennaborense (strain DSM 12168 / CIP 105900 / DD5/3) TaxID=906968 RepID=F4LL62_TREBD|nr:GDP-L-fucose synthase [Treponema brennaborense]AEE17636.1 GDP-L-fucose synthase [Treponema brennaborense DSM 12168]
MNKNAKIYIAGHRGLVGGAIARCLTEKGYTNIVTRTHSELDLLNQAAVNAFFAAEKPEYVFLAAAHVGGIGANSAYPADFIYQNMMIGFNVVEAARVNGVKKLMNLGSTCIYPKMTPQPIKEESLLSGFLEPTNDAYALAKISVIKLCTAYNRQHGTNFLSVMPTNLYGLGDNYELQGSHVFPAMIRKFHEAKASGEDVVQLWGDGSPLREFLYAGDLADAVVYLMENKDAADLRNPAGDFVNVGTGKECTIKELAETVEAVVYADVRKDGRKCKMEWNTSKPNGTPRKLCDVTRVNNLGWKAQVDVRQGIEIAYNDFLHGNVRK